MNSATFPNNATVVNLLPLAAATSTAAGAGVDIVSYKGFALALLDSAAGTGTTPTNTIKLQGSPDASMVTSLAYAGTGNGKIEVQAGPDPVAETITFTASSATSFAVAGGTSGSIGTLTVGTRFTSPQVNALITAGSVAFVSTDVFTVPTTTRTWTDIVGGAFTVLTTALSRQTLSVNVDALPRFIRAYGTITGANPSFTRSLNLLMMDDG